MQRPVRLDRMPVVPVMNPPIPNSLLADVTKWVVVGGVEWAPIGLTLPNGTEIGISRRGFWAAGGEKRVQEFVDGESTVVFRVCLEIAYDKFDAMLKGAVGRCGLPPAVAEMFPRVQIVEEGLRSGSTYWAELALEWAGELPPDVVPVAGLQELSRARWAAQSVQHRARRLMNRGCRGSA